MPQDTQLNYIDCGYSGTYQIIKTTKDYQVLSSVNSNSKLVLQTVSDITLINSLLLSSDDDDVIQMQPSLYTDSDYVGGYISGDWAYTPLAIPNPCTQSTRRTFKYIDYHQIKYICQYIVANNITDANIFNSLRQFNLNVSMKQIYKQFCKLEKSSLVHSEPFYHNEYNHNIVCASSNIHKYFDRALYNQ